MQEKSYTTKMKKFLEENKKYGFEYKSAVLKSLFDLVRNGMPIKEAKEIYDKEGSGDFDKYERLVFEKFVKFAKEFADGENENLFEKNSIQEVQSKTYLEDEKDIKIIYITKLAVEGMIDIKIAEDEIRKSNESFKNAENKYKEDIDFFSKFLQTMGDDIITAYVLEAKEKTCPDCAELLNYLDSKDIPHDKIEVLWNDRSEIEEISGQSGTPVLLAGENVYLGKEIYEFLDKKL